MAFELNGIIIEIFPAQTFNKGFRKREFVIESGDKYPQKIVFGLVQDKCDMIDSYGLRQNTLIALRLTESTDSRELTLVNPLPTSTMKTMMKSSAVLELKPLHLKNQHRLSLL